MKHIVKIFLVAVLMSFTINMAVAANLKSDDVKKFIGATSDVENFAVAMKKEGRDIEEASQKEAANKKFEPYTQSVAFLKKTYADDYKDMNEIVTKHGFESPEQWAGVGDQVMHAYMAIKIEEQNPEALKNIPQLTDEMKKKMPPETLAQVEKQIRIQQTIAAVPKENKDAVKANIAGIDTWLKKAEEQAKAQAADSKDAKTDAKPEPKAKPQ